jgi:hypothetical protein
MTARQFFYTEEQWERIERCLFLRSVEQEESAALLASRWWRDAILAAVTTYPPGGQKAQTEAERRIIVENGKKWAKGWLRWVKGRIDDGSLDAEHPRVKGYKSQTLAILDEASNPGRWAAESWHRAMERRIAEDSIDADDAKMRIEKYRKQKDVSNPGLQGLKKRRGRPRGSSKYPGWLNLIWRLRLVFNHFNQQGDPKSPISRFLQACLEPRFESLRKDDPPPPSPTEISDRRSTAWKSPTQSMSKRC